MTQPACGKKLPAFSLETTAGTFRLRDARGSKLVIYFYPRDNTSGCTREGQAFSGLHRRFVRAGAIILGVSPDSIESHRRFKEKMGFPFELGSDPGHELASLLGVWKEKTMYGRKVMGIERSTFLVDEKGILRQEWRKVRVDGHAEAVLAAVQAL